MEERKQKLINALKEEREIFLQRGQSTLEHDIAIEYLIIGKTYSDPEKFELLDACMYDYETLCSDYNV
jgi:hypothetical protein